MSQLRRLSDCMSPMSWGFVTLALLPPVWVIFRPSPREFALVALVDWITFFLNQKVEGRIFQRLFPDTAVYFDGLELSAVRAMPLDQRVQLFESFMRFPRRRALFAYVGSLIKVIPAVLVVTFVWGHSV